MKFNLIFPDICAVTICPLEKLYLKNCVGQHFGDYALEFDHVVLRQTNHSFSSPIPLLRRICASCFRSDRSVCGISSGDHPAPSPHGARCFSFFSLGLPSLRSLPSAHKHISFFCAAHYRQQPAFVLACERQNQIACFHIGCQTQPPSGSVSITAPSSVTAIVCS